MAVAIAIAKLTQPDYFNNAQQRKRIQFITIGFSHYGELARWTLLALKQDFDEHNFSPGMHILSALRVRVADTEKHISNSSRMIAKSETGGGSPSGLPLAVLSDRRVLLDSWDIAQYCMPSSPMDDELKRILDQEIGPLSRKLFYQRILREENLGTFDAMWEKDASWFWRTAHSWCKDRLYIVMRDGVEFGRPSVEEQAHQDLFQVFEKVEQEFLNKTDRKYIGGDQPGLADYALAALSAPIVCPREYCRGRFAKELDLFHMQDTTWAAYVTQFRNTKVGEHCQMMYREHQIPVQEAELS